MKLLLFAVLSSCLVFGECCRAGYYENGEGDCVYCPLGSYCAEGATEPSKCPAGTFGPYQAARSKDQCIPCSPGDYNEEEGAARCKQCMPGYYCPSGSVKPTPCPVGTASQYTRASRKDLCRPCYPGYYSDEVALEKCKVCPEDNYCEAGATKPTPCPEGQTSRSYSRSEDDCKLED